MSRDAAWRRLPGAIVPFRWDVFAKKYALLLRAERSKGAVAGQLAFRLGLFAALQAGWALDEVAARGWRDARLRGPVFVLGHQRSGTTFLHRLLASDGRATALRLHEMLLPAVTSQRAIAGLGSLDARLGGALARRLRATENRLFGPLDDLHRSRFDAIEEDELPLWSVFASVMVANDAPSAAASPDFDPLRDFASWTPAAQASALGWYRACLLKKARRVGGAPWVIAKNPAFTHKVDALDRVFPDARYVFLHRDPLATIPSRLSLIRAIWRRRLPGFDEMTPAQIETVVADSVRTYRAAVRFASALPPDKHIVIAFDALRADPAREVSRICARFGIGQPDRHLRAALAALRPRGPTRHRYDLDQFGLDAATLSQRLGDVDLVALTSRGR